nr:hypothetical protein [Tanacetum cinerariifolium]
MSTSTFAKTYNLATKKVKKVNDQEQIQALIDKKKVIITEDSIRSDLHFNDAEGTASLLNEAIFKGLASMGAKTTAWNEFSSTMEYAIICLADNQKFNFSKFLHVFLDKQVEGMARHTEMYIISSQTKKIFDNMRRIGAGFSGVITPLFDTMMVQAPADMGDTPVETHQTPIVDQPSTFKPQKKQKPRRKQRKEAEVSHDESKDEDHVPAPSNDPLPCGEDSFTLNELMVFCTYLQEQGWKNDDEMFGVNDLAREEVVMDTTIGEHEEQIIEDVSTAEPITTAGEVVTTTTTVKDNADPTTDVTEDEITMAQALVVLKSTKPKVVIQEKEMSTTIPAAATTVTTAVPTPRAKDVTEDEITMAQALVVLKSTKPKDKGKAKIIEPEIPIKKKDQMRIDEEYARKLEAEEQEAARLSRCQQDEEANNSWDNIQDMMDVDRLLAERLQAREREEFFEVQKARLLVELIEKRKKHFTTLRAQEKRNKPPTKTQMKSQMSTYLKHMGGYKQSHLKGRSFNEIKKLFDREMRKVNGFIAMDSKAQKSSAKEAQESSIKRTAKHLESDISKKQKVDENVKPVNDYSEELKKCMEIVPDDGYEVLIEATPLSSKSPTIIDYKIHKEGKKTYFKIIRAYGNSQVYQTFEKMFKNFNREDLEVLWAVVKDRFKKEKLVDDMDKLLFRTLKPCLSVMLKIPYGNTNKDYPRSMNGDENHNSRISVRKQAPLAREYTYPDFMKCKPLYFKGTKGVVKLTQRFERMEIVFRTNLKKMMTDKYCPRGEVKKLEVEMWNLKVKGTDVDAIEFSTELMEKKISTLAERQAENKKKLITTTKLNNNLPRSKCTIKCANYKRVGHLTRDCRSPAATNNKRNLTSYEYGNQGHYRSDCPKLKNQNHGNQVGGTGAREMVHALGGGETNQDLNNMEDDINA